MERDPLSVIVSTLQPCSQLSTSQLRIGFTSNVTWQLMHNRERVYHTLIESSLGDIYHTKSASDCKGWQFGLISVGCSNAWPEDAEPQSEKLEPTLMV